MIFCKKLIISFLAPQDKMKQDEVLFHLAYFSSDPAIAASKKTAWRPCTGETGVECPGEMLHPGLPPGGLHV